MSGSSLEEHGTQQESAPDAEKPETDNEATTQEKSPDDVKQSPAKAAPANSGSGASKKSSTKSKSKPGKVRELWSGRHGDEVCNSQLLQDKKGEKGAGSQPKDDSQSGEPTQPCGTCGGEFIHLHYCVHCAETVCSRCRSVTSASLAHIHYFMHSFMGHEYLPNRHS